MRIFVIFNVLLTTATASGFTALPRASVASSGAAVARPPADSGAIAGLPPVDLSGTSSAVTAVGAGGRAVASRGGVGGVEPPKPKSNTLLVGFYFTLWYVLNIAYNITNKNALKAISLPWTISVTQLVVGSIFVIPLWLLNLRETPGLSRDNVNGLLPIATCHMLSHLSAVIGLGAGAISFVHIVKAAEPLFTALFSAIFLGQIFSPLVYVTLLPVIGGVSLASFKELDFSWVALGGAMGSNLAASTRAILSKRRMGLGMGKNMSPANMYGVLTIMATVMLLPLSAIKEGPSIQTLWKSTVTDGDPELGKEIIFNTVASGLFFYLYNEVAFRCLDVVHPVTHAVGNTFKRIFLIATSIIVYKTKLTPLAALGSFMAIGGVLLYSLAKEYSAKNAAVKAHASR